MRSNSISSNKANAATYTWRLYREIEKLSVIKASYYFLSLCCAGSVAYKDSKISSEIRGFGLVLIISVTDVILLNE